MDRQTSNSQTSSGQPISYQRTWIITGLLALLLSLIARVWYSSRVPLSYDETHNLMIGVLTAQGYAAYREVYSVIGPFALSTMRVAAAIFGPTEAARTLMIAYSLAGIAALYVLVARQTASRFGPRFALWAAFSAAIFFSFNPDFFFVSTSLNLEAGSLAFALLTLAALERYRTHRAQPRAAIWVFISGLLFGLCATFKIFAPYIPAIVALQLWWIVGRPTSATPEPATKLDTTRLWAWLRLGLLWGCGVLTIIALWLLVYDRAWLTQVIGSRFELRDAIESEAGVNIAEEVVMADLLPYVPLMLGALLGLFVLWRATFARAHHSEHAPARDDALLHAWIWPLWFVLAAAFLLSHDPVRPRHLVTALPPLAALSGIALAWATGRVAAITVPQRREYRTAFAAIPAVILLFLALAAPLNAMEIESFVDSHPVRQSAIDYLRRATAPGDCVVSKENRLLFLAGRLAPPDLSLISTARLFSGLLSAQDIAREAAARDCAALVYADTFDELIPDLRAEADRLYAVRLTLLDPREPDYPLDLYTVHLGDERTPTNPLDVRLGESIHLAGYDLSPAPWIAGETVHFSTYWQATAPISHDYKYFIHLLDANGAQASAYDHYPFSLDRNYNVDDITLSPALISGKSLRGDYPATGLLPTSLWPVATALKETHALDLPADLAPGEYTLAFGLYDEATMQRLPITHADGTLDNQLIIGPIQIQARQDEARLSEYRGELENPLGLALSRRPSYQGGVPLSWQTMSIVGRPSRAASAATVVMDQQRSTYAQAHTTKSIVVQAAFICTILPGLAASRTRRNARTQSCACSICANLRNLWISLSRHHCAASPRHDEAC